MKKLTFILCLFLFSFVSGQIKHPKASPFTSISQDVGLTSIRVDYSRPATRGRTIFGGIVPYGRIWRVGANESTKVTFASDVVINGDTLVKGIYALYAFPEKNAWEIVFHSNTSHWGDGRKNYDASEDALRIIVKPKLVQDFQENFLITFDLIEHNSVHFLLRWANTEIEIPIKIDTHGFMEAEIKNQLTNNSTAQTYYEAARYYQEQNINYETALMYLEIAIEKGGDTYYFHRVKSLVEAALGDYKDAIVSAKKSLELADLEGKDEFVRMNQKNIESWNRVLLEQE